MERPRGNRGVSAPSEGVLRVDPPLRVGGAAGDRASLDRRSFRPEGRAVYGAAADGVFCLPGVVRVFSVPGIY